MYLYSFPLSSSFICFQSIPKQNKSIYRPYEVNFFCNILLLVRLIQDLAPVYLFAILSNFCLVWIICLTEHILDFQDSLLLLHSCLWNDLILLLSLASTLIFFIPFSEDVGTEYCLKKTCLFLPSPWPCSKFYLLFLLFTLI